MRKLIAIELSLLIGMGMVLASLGVQAGSEAYAAASVPPGLKADYCTPALRAGVEQLKRDVAREASNEENVRQRVSVLWDWANARSLAGFEIEPNLPAVVTYARIGQTKNEITDRIKKPSLVNRFKKYFMRKMQRKFILWKIDFGVKDMQMREQDPEIFGHVAAKPLTLTAAAYHTIEQTWTVGSRDLEPGASIMLGMHTNSLMTKYQADDPAADNYVSVRCSNPSAQFKVTSRLRFGILGGDHKGFKKNLVFELAEGRLTRGDTLTVIYGDKSGGSRGFRVHTVTNDAYPLPLFVAFGDEDAPLLFKLRKVGMEHLLDLVPFTVLGTQVVGVKGFAPSVVGVGEPFEVSVRSEDRYYNRAGGPIPGYKVFLNKKEIGEIKAGTDAITVKDMTIGAPGVYRFTFQSVDGTISGDSNPIWVRENPVNRIYWGDTHGHCGYSEAVGSPEGYYRFGRDDARLDFLTLSEHDIWLDDGEWKTLKSIVKAFNEEGKFITYAGYEWTSPYPLGGHHNVLFRTPDNRKRIPLQDYSNKEAFYEGLRAHHAPEDVLIIPHAHNPRMFLKQGHRIGFVGASDDHQSHPGYAAMNLRMFYNQGGLAGVIAPRKTTDVLFDAMRNLSVYATSGERMILDVAVNGASMGTRIPLSSPNTIKGRVMGTDAIDTIAVVKNDKIIWEKDFRTRPTFNQEENTVVDVDFFSRSNPVDFIYDTPRQARVWKGALTVEGATLDSYSLDLIHPYAEPVYLDSNNANRLVFTTHSRGKIRTIQLKLAGVTPDTRINVTLDESMENNRNKPLFRKPKKLPPAEFALNFSDLKKGRLVHDLVVDPYYTDSVSLRLVAADAPLDRHFAFTDDSKAQEGDYYYVKVRQANGGMAWSSPVWIE
ncbi:MAG: DUF3604 domain-containing protein [Deltaproteobacteria bacterium]|nr:DUF3604 domain-containing protein [Deltaproteobacteria bacterium]